MRQARSGPRARTKTGQAQRQGGEALLAGGVVDVLRVGGDLVHLDPEALGVDDRAEARREFPAAVARRVRFERQRGGDPLPVGDGPVLLVEVGGEGGARAHQVRRHRGRRRGRGSLGRRGAGEAAEQERQGGGDGRRSGGAGPDGAEPDRRRQQEAEPRSGRNGGGHRNLEGRGRLGRGPGMAGGGRRTPGRTRTCDLRIRNPSLSPLSYRRRVGAPGPSEAIPPAAAGDGTRSTGALRGSGGRCGSPARRDLPEPGRPGAVRDRRGSAVRSGTSSRRRGRPAP